MVQVGQHAGVDRRCQNERFCRSVVGRACEGSIGLFELALSVIAPLIKTWTATLLGIIFMLFS